MMLPRFGLLNHGYDAWPDDQRRSFKAAMQTIFDILQVNVPNGNAAGCDDMLVWFRGLGFLSDPAFVFAMEPYADDKVMLARIWRVYTLCWAARSCMSLPGDYVDLGTYDGRTVDVMRRYCEFDDSDKRWFLYDAFDHHPAGQDKQNHAPGLAAEVFALMFHHNYRIKAGLLPATLDDRLGAIAFLQVDLNSAQAELACLEILWPRVVPGGIVILDDYGAAEHRRSYDLEKAFFDRHGQTVLELPTSQGMVMKR